jgi:hypothetical protein
MLLRTVLRAASAWFIWRWLEPRWRSTLALVLGWLLVIVLHAEYVEYVQITESTELLWISYLIKWVVVLSAILAYLWFSVLGSSKTPPAQAPSKTPQTDKGGTGDTPHGDGFDFLREKKTLQSRGDQVIDAHKLPKKNSD